MKFGNNNLKNALVKWGKQQEVLPPKNEMLKHQILDALPRKDNVKAKVRRPTGFLKIGFALAAFVLVANVGTKFVLSNLSSATHSGSVVYDEAVYGEEQQTSLASPAPSYGEMVYDRFTKSAADDTREYLKTGYNVNIKARKVQSLAMQLQTMIRGYGGRVDNASISTKSAYISFVVPKSSFDRFITELKDIVPERFLEESIQLENRLPQKQQIEQNTQTNEEWIRNLQDQKQALIAAHDSKVASIQKQINNYTYRISTFQKERNATTSTERWAAIDKDVTWLNSQVRYQKQQLVSENSQFEKALANVDAKIKSAEKERSNLEKQDENLIKDVETVSGHISIRWIGFFHMLNLYAPIYWIMGGAAVLLILFLILGRRPSLNDDLLN